MIAVTLRIDLVGFKSWRARATVLALCSTTRVLLLCMPILHVLVAGPVERPACEAQTRLCEVLKGISVQEVTVESDCHVAYLAASLPPSRRSDHLQIVPATGVSLLPTTAARMCRVGCSAAIGNASIMLNRRNDVGGLVFQTNPTISKTGPRSWPLACNAPQRIIPDAGKTATTVPKPRMQATSGGFLVPAWMVTFEFTEFFLSRIFWVGTADANDGPV